MRTNPDFKL